LECCDPLLRRQRGIQDQYRADDNQQDYNKSEGRNGPAQPTNAIHGIQFVHTLHRHVVFLLTGWRFVELRKQPISLRSASANDGSI
jgi:hypothetical protein